MTGSSVRPPVWLCLLFYIVATEAAWAQGFSAIPDLPADGRLQDAHEFVPCRPARLTLDLRPVDAGVELPDIEEQYVPGMSLNTCSVRVKVHKEGYLAKTVVIDLEEDTQASITLDEAPPPRPAPPTSGTLTLQLSPADAEVTLPDIRQRYRPGVTVPLGRLRVMVRREGFRSFERTVAVTGDTVVPVELTPLPPTRLTLDLFPSDAEVELPGIDEPYTRGMTVPSGPVQVRVTRRGYADVERLIDAEGDTRIQIEMELRTTGTLTLDLFPADTEVLFLGEGVEDDYQRGMTLPMGRVRVAFRRSGYQELVRVIDIVGDVRELVELEPLPTATLTLDLSPEDAVADLPDLGQRYWPGMPLTLGKHRLVVRQAGYEDFDETIQLDDDKTLRVELVPTRVCRPTLVRGFKPSYPKDARSQEIEGHVDVEFQIVKSGRVRAAVVAEASPPQVFDEAAINAIRKFRYSLPPDDCASVDSVTNKVRFRFDFRD